jgi:hypothetical protein
LVRRFLLWGKRRSPFPVLCHLDAARRSLYLNNTEFKTATGRHWSQPALTGRATAFRQVSQSAASMPRAQTQGTNHIVKMKWSPADGRTVNVLRNGVIVQTSLEGS